MNITRGRAQAQAQRRRSLTSQTWRPDAVARAVVLQPCRVAAPHGEVVSNALFCQLPA
jgi:hypothetical protein